MKKTTMTRLLHGVLIVAVLLAGLMFFAWLPMLGKEMAVTEPEFAWAYWPCLIWAWVFALPVFAAVYPAWLVCSSISAPGGAFTRQNARCLRVISLLAFADAVVFPAGMLILAFMGAGQPGLAVLVTPAVMFVCAAVGIAALVLSHLVDDAAEMKEENDLTV
ncbi:MAG: DUF2975 domain-containing protein [Oscillospiraceae bacterium]|nr:DUF2975 domain-containing protein [Oscillospiraceae bacterium]